MIEMVGIAARFDKDAVLMPFDARIQGTPGVVTINPGAIAYVSKGYCDYAAIHFIGGEIVEIVAPYDEVRAALGGAGGYKSWVYALAGRKTEP